MRSRVAATALVVLSFGCAACGGSPRAATADIVAIRQPTPDPTLDAVVRGLPRALADVIAPVATATPTPGLAPKPKLAPPTPTARPAQRGGRP